MVFDAPTLILIAKAEMLTPFLGGLPMEIAIPAEVERECYAVKRSLDALSIEKAVKESEIKVMAVKDRHLITRLEADFSLGRGEAEAIALAAAEKAGLLAIDDKNGINACKLLGIPFTTAIGILVRIREKRLLTVGESLAKLNSLAKHGRYQLSILEDAKRRLEAKS